MIGLIFTGVWIAWAITFGIVEAIALANKQTDDTLSEKIRDLFHIKTLWGKITWGIAFGLFATWFFCHVMWGANYWF